MKKSKLAIFDMDGTLFKTEQVNYHAYKHALAQYGCPDLDYDYFAKTCNGRHYKEFLPVLTGGKLDIIQAIHETKKNVYHEYLVHAVKNEHLLDMAQSIRDHYYLAVVTTASRKNAEDILQFFACLDLFDLILTHEDVSQVKPHPEGFLKAMQHFNVTAQQTMIFEDSSVGVCAAQQTGAAVFVVENF